MKKFYTTCFLLFVAITMCHAQFVLRGIVRDNTTDESIVGANIVVSHPTHEAVADVNGAFALKYHKPTAEVQVSFIGYVTRTITLDTARETVVSLAIDKTIDEDMPRRKVRMRLDLGYYGDATYARNGVMAVMPVQGIGRKDWMLFTAFKYWKGDGNNGIDASISKHLHGKLGGIIAHNVFLSYRSFNYPTQGFQWTQYRTLLTRYLPMGFAIDAGAGYNQISMNNKTPRDDRWRWSGSIGLIKRFRMRGDLGIHTNFNYTPGYRFFEAGAFKNFGSRKNAFFTAIVKYYRYTAMEGVMLSLAINIFSTQVFCCDSPQIHFDYYHAMK